MGMHRVDIFAGRAIERESQLAINSYHVYDDNHPNDRTIRCAYIIATPTPPFLKVLPFGIKDANHLRRAYPLLPHGHDKATWRLVDGS